MNKQNELKRKAKLSKREILKSCMSKVYCYQTRFDFLDDEEFPMIYKAMELYAKQRLSELQPVNEYTVPYLKSEKAYALKEMQKLGINIEEQPFEQCVNSLISLLQPVNNLKIESVKEGDCCGFGTIKPGTSFEVLSEENQINKTDTEARAEIMELLWVFSCDATTDPKEITERIIDLAQYLNPKPQTDDEPSEK